MLWQWGSFPAPDNAFTPGDPSVPYTGGNLTPTELPGLLGALGNGVTVRKVLSEQGLFVALLSNGHVYTWGVYFDLTAGGILRDLQATRVLGLPPLRDIMPGGFNGYGVRPFDRNTAMGIDYRGGMWKVRGRVAEQFDPDNPAQQRRPQVQSPRPDCATCHLFLSDWPLTPAAPTSTAVCSPPTTIHGSGVNSLIHAETQCEQCHNPARTPPIAAFPDGWLACVRPTNLPPRPTVIAPPQSTTACVIPPRHVFTPPGTVCASCHNSVLATPLSQLNPPCAQPQSIELPTLPATAAISAIVNDSGATVAPGAYTADTTPQLNGTLSVALSGNQTLAVSRNATLIGNAIVSGTGWTFTDNAPQGLANYTVRVMQGASFGATSNAYAIRVDSVPPAASAQVTGFTDATLGAIAPGGFATDTRPTISGTLSAAIGTDEVVQVLRNGQDAGNATVTGTNWSLREAAALSSGNYSYTARAKDLSQNVGASGAAFAVTIIAGVPTATISSITNDANTTIAPGAITSDATPTLNGSLSAALPSGHVLRVLRNGVSAGIANVTGSSWSLTDNAPQGVLSYSARVEAGAVIGTASAAYTITVDSVAPTQTADVTAIADDYIGTLAAGASTADQTPTISGTLSAALGSGEQLRLLRRLGTTTTAVQVSPTPTGTSWSYTEPALLSAGTYTYQVQVFDAAGNNGALGLSRAVTIDLSAVPLPNAAAVLATVNGVTPSGGAVPVSSNNTPTLAGTIQRALNAGEVVRVYRNAVGVANATVTAQNWSYTNTSLADGSYAFSARVEQSGNSSVFGSSSVTVNVPIDATAPTQTAAIGGIFDDANVSVGGSNTTDTTPRISGTLSGALAAGEVVELVRSGGAGTVTRNATVTGGTNWSLQETVAMSAATYTYTARVLDAAGNRGPNSVQTVTVIAALPAVSSINVAYSAGLAAPRANGTVVGNGGSIADTTPTVQGTIAFSLAGGASVTVFRGGTAVGTASTTGTNWTFTDANVGQGSRTYTARVQNGTAYGSTSSSYTVIVDTVAPTLTFSAITGSSSVMPNTTVSGATTPPNGSISSGGTTNDASPALRVQLSGALGSDTLVIRRNGTIVSAVSTVSCGTNCFSISVPAPVSLPAPLSTPNTTTVPTATQGYSFTVMDAAGNEGTASTTFNVVFNYFACDLVRANATHNAVNGINHSSWTNLNCSGCHSTTNAAAPTPAGTLVAVPLTTPTYWCRRP